MREHRLRRALVAFVAVAAFALPGAAWAHGGGTYVSVATSTPPTVDGSLADAAWANAPAYDVTFGTSAATVRFVHTSTDLYVGVSVSDATFGSNPEFTVYFDNNHDGVKDVGDDAWLGFLTVSGEDFFYNTTPSASHYADSVGGGTDETTAAAVGASGVVTFEIEHPLCSSDTVHDVCLHSGDKVGVDFQYEPGTAAGVFYDAPGSNLFDPSSNWADLTIGDTQAPTVGWVNPESGASLSGSVPLSVDATDNVGVDHVTYDYVYSGRSYPLGSSSDAPFTVSFDTTKFPNVEVGGGQIVAQAFDAAGNASAKVPVDVGIANDGSPQLGTIHGALDNDYIFLQDFWPNVSVDVSVLPAVGEPPISTTVTTDGSGSAAIAPDGRWNLVPGTQITADDGRGAHTVTLENITITRADTTKNAVFGTAPPGRDVRVFLFSGGVQVAESFPTTDETGHWTAPFPEFSVQPGMHVLADMLSDPLGDRSRADYDIPLPSGTITITGDATSAAGAASAPLAGIPLDAIRGSVSGGPSGAPLGGIPLGGIPLGGIPLGGIPLGGIPLGGIGFTAAELRQNGLGGVPLSTIPLNAPDSWQSRLDANATFHGTPVQSVTLAQVLGTSVVDGVTLDDIDLAGSPLGGIPLGGIALGSVPLGGIPLGGIPLGGIPLGSNFSSTPTALQGWCDYVNRQPGFSCTDPTTLTNQTVIGLALEGVPLGGIPLGGIPLGGIPLGGIPLGGIPIGTPLGGIPLGGIDLSGTPLGGIPLGGIDLGASPLGGIPLGGIPVSAQPAVLDCTLGSAADCQATTTLAQAAAHIRPDAKVQDLGYYCVAGSPSDPSCNAGDTPITLADFVKGLPSDVTLEDLFATILAKSAYDWENLPIPGFPIQDFSGDGGTVTYTATFALNGGGSGTTTATVRVKLPDGARYVPGSTKLNGSALIGEINVPEPDYSAAQNELTWQLPGIPIDGTQQILTFEVKPGLTLGVQDASATLSAGELVPTASTPTPAATSVTQTFAGNGDIGTPKAIAKDTLYFGYTPNGTDRDYFTLPLPETGTQVTVHLSHLHVDDDLVVFGPTVAPLRVPHAGPTATLAPNVTPSLQQRTQAIQPEVLADVPVTPPAGQSVVGISDNRGLADEEVTFIVPEHSPGAVATIQVSSYDGDYSNEPWMLRVEESPALPLPSTCTSTPTVGGGTTMTMPSSVGGSTLYLFNSKRFGDLYGAPAESNVWSKLQALASRSDAAGGTVIPIDAAPGVGSALTAWYGDQCSPGASNDVVRAVGRYLDSIPSTYKYVVIVGGYDVLPPGLVLDDTSYVNEREYAPTFLGPTDNMYLADYALGYLPTDDPYGDTNYSGSGAYVPEAAVGRLVETPAQITGQIDQYVTAGGSVNPTTALVTGYDFLSDGAQAIASNLQPHVQSPTTLINETWTKNDLLGLMFPGTNPPLIDSINAHYDHHRSLPADQNAADTQTNLFTTADLAGHSTAGRIVITMGCHSGLSVSDLLIGSALGTDWDQTYALQGAIAYIANTGFGLGETAGVAYSEQLHALLAQRLDGSMTVGQALMYAKQEYAGSVPTTSGYQLKVLDEADMFGLPMYRIGSGSTPAPPAPLPVVTDPVTGLAATSFNLSPSYTQAAGPNGSYYTDSGSAAYEDRRPIEPLVKLDVTEPNLVAHGALVTGLSSTDQTGFDAAFSRVVDDSSALSPELVGDTIFPAKLQSITSFATPTGPRQRLLLYGGQYRSDSIPDAQGVGIQRLFNSLSGTVLYASPGATDFAAPTFGPVTVSSPSPTAIGFAVDVNDDSGVDGVKRVVALYNDATGTWRSIDLSHAPGSTRWSGAGSFSGTTSEWFIQAADGSGNVGVTSNKATVASVVPPSSTGAINAALAGQQGPEGWFTSDVTATISGAPGITYSLDGAAFTSGTSLTVSGTGVHTLDFQGSDGSHGSVDVPIDVTAPTISIQGGTIPSGTAPQIVCADAGSGVASCDTTPSPLDLSVGTHSVHVKAVDRVGNVTEADGSYTIDAFTGFFSPVNNPPTANVAKAGSAIPVKFSLGLNLGLSIFQPGYPLVQAVPCDPGAPSDTVEQTTTANASGLTYDATSNQYTYVWKTTSAWSGTCKQLVVRLTDGTEHRANFRFK